MLRVAAELLTTDYLRPQGVEERANQMIRCDETTVGYDLAEARGGKSEVTFSDRVCQQRVMFSLPNGLVVSSNDEVRRKLAEILGYGGLAPVLASTVAESRTAGPSRRVHGSLR